MIEISVYYVGYIFFYQAEDGIRDLVRSRGLGDVYKRQDGPRLRPCGGTRRLVASGSWWFPRHDAHRQWPPRHLAGHLRGEPAVSYTHLTLPTSDLV